MQECDGARNASDERLRLAATDQEERFPLTALDELSSITTQERCLVWQPVSWSAVQAAQQLTEQDKARYEGAWFNSLNIFTFTPYQLQTKEDQADQGQTESIERNQGQDQKESRQRITRTKLLVDSDWWKWQSKDLQNQVQTLCQRHQVSLVEWEGPSQEFYPHDAPTTPESAHPILRGLYHLYHNQFTYRNFQQCTSDDAQVVELTSFETRWLVELGRLRCLTGRKLREDDMEDFLPRTLKTIQTYLDKHQDTGIFCKTHDKSAKNDVTLRPLYTVEQVIEQLTISRDVLGMLELVLTQNPDSTAANGSACCYLILLPWQDQITSHNEFRVFVQNHKVRAMAQQKWYLNLTCPTRKENDDDSTTNSANQEPLTRDKALMAARAAIRQYEHEWIHQLPSHWRDAVLDVWIDFEQYSEGADNNVATMAHLIEVNPGGRWSSSGSSLFEWRADVDILHRYSEEEKNNDVYVRIVADDQ